MTTRSGVSGSDETEGYASMSITDLRPELTGQIFPGKRAARRFFRTVCPTLLGIELAPTTAMERGCRKKPNGGVALVPVAKVSVIVHLRC
jgi:hypothetical protein